MEQQQYRIEDIVVDPACQARAALNPEVVDEYAERYENEKAMPPVELFEVEGEQGSSLYLVEGFHRVTAVQKAGKGHVVGKVVGKGSVDEARWKAAAANLGHGLRRTRADKQRAVQLCLDNPMAKEHSDRTIAQHCQVSHTFVAKVRKGGADPSPPKAPAAPSSPSKDKSKPKAPAEPTPLQRAQKACLEAFVALKALHESGHECHPLVVSANLIVQKLGGK